MSAEMIDIPGLKIEYDLDAGPDQQILLEQEWTGNTDRVAIHLSHVRLLAERFGLLPPSDAEAAATIARMAGQMHNLRERISQLNEWIYQTNQRGHEDLDTEFWYSAATLDIIDAYLSQLPASLANPPKSGAVAPRNPPEGGAVGRPIAPKTGAVPGQLDLVSELEGRHEQH